MIHHFSLIASSEESVDFYASLGFVEGKRINRTYDTVVLMKGHCTGLELFIDPRHPRREGIEPLGLRNISIQVEDLDGWCEEHNCDPASIETDWNGERFVFVVDPDGNSVQIHE